MGWIVLGQIAVGLVEAAAAIFILFFCVFGCVAVWQDMIIPRWNRRITQEPSRRAVEMEAERKIRKIQMRNLRIRMRRIEKRLIDDAYAMTTPTPQGGDGK